MKTKWIALGAAVFAASMVAADIDKILAGSPSHDIQSIDYDGQHIPDALDALLGYNTVIRLKGELAREVSAGNAADPQKPGSGNWIVSIAKEGDAVYVKPTRPNAATNIEIRTDHNNRYPLFIKERSQERGAHPNLEYIIGATSEAMVRKIQDGPQYVLTSKYDEAREEAERYKRERDELQAKLDKLNPPQTAKAERAGSFADVVCDYDLKHSKVTELPFRVSNICHDKEHTYIWAQGATDHFSIQDVKQGVPSIVFPEFNKDTGRYTVHHVIEKGRLQIGTGKRMKSADFEKGAALMADQEKPTQQSASQGQTGPSQAPPPPPGYTYGWVQTPQAPAAQQAAQPTGGMPDWAKSKKTLMIVLAVLGFFLLSNVFEKPQQQQTRKPANQAAGTRLTPKEQIDAAAKANQETARLEKNNTDLRKRQEQVTGNATNGTTTTAGTTTNAGSSSGNPGQPSETQKIVDQIRAERLKQQYTSLWTSPIAATWEPPQTTLTNSNPTITGTINAPGAKGNPATGDTNADTDPNNKQFAYDHSTGPYHVIQKGTLIGATLLMDLDGERGGPVIAQIDKDDQVYVKQTDTLLIPEGTTVIGTAQPVSSGSQHLLGVSFDSLVMQDGYALALTKPATGLSQDGKGGLTGQVDTHLLSRLGWSFAIGAIQGISSGAIGIGNNSGPAVILRAPGADMSQLFQGILNRPNSMKIPAGTRIKIILTDDLTNVPEWANHQMKAGAL